ncbi:MAG: protein-methionine-sulfoxide reductase catalytic subunit MsrP [Gammaproteobacteria bacterium]|nr:MAG: protein-methionine-sulfoxide reductase catalytic subunit MsrP [Gammaproteobacteria bacterium]
MKLAKLRSSDITDKSVYKARRRVLRAGAGLGIGGLAGASTIGLGGGVASALLPANAGAAQIGADGFKAPDALTEQSVATSYNNFYELGTAKSDPLDNAHLLTVEPWSIRVDGLCGKPGTYTLEDILKGQSIEERIYRFRCVEAWSMVIPWNGFPLAGLLRRFEPSSDARYVAFETVVQKGLPGIERGVLDFPYVEGLRMDEAMHPLTLIATGMYGEDLPPQNGAPLRLVVPWKYGYKSIKSIVRIAFTASEPPTSWNRNAPHEYGFYSNVNPERSHPRWSQAKERRLTGGGTLSSLLSPKIETDFMNGYAEQVASLYDGMDLQKFH